MRDAGKLLFRVGHLSCPKGGMGRTWEDHLVVASEEGYDVKFMDGGIDAWPYEVVFGRLSANETPSE